MNDDQEWRERLDADQYHVLRQCGTEPPFSGKLLHEKRSGEFFCAGCGSLLFLSSDKYDSGSGWPSYTAPASDTALRELVDTSHGMTRIEVRCGSCDGHLGHVFPDGPGPNGLRYCINSAAMGFEADGDDESA